MTIAITIWETRISPVFDSARNLLVVETDGAEMTGKKVVMFDSHLFDRFLMQLLELEVRVFICGALCEGPARILEAHGIEVISFLTGEAEEVLHWYLQGRDLERFSLPGCLGGMCRRRWEGRWKLKRLTKEDGICAGLDSKARRAKDRRGKGEDALA